MKKTNEKERCKTIDELKRAFNEVHSVVANDTRFIAKALMFLAEQSVVAPKAKRKPSAWQVFFGKGMKEGKSPTEIAAVWKGKTTKV